MKKPCSSKRRWGYKIVFLFLPRNMTQMGCPGGIIILSTGNNVSDSTEIVPKIWLWKNIVLEFFQELYNLALLVCNWLISKEIWSMTQGTFVCFWWNLSMANWATGKMHHVSSLKLVYTRVNVLLNVSIQICSMCCITCYCITCYRLSYNSCCRSEINLLRHR